MRAIGQNESVVRDVLTTSQEDFSSGPFNSLGIAMNKEDVVIIKPFFGLNDKVFFCNFSGKIPCQVQTELGEA